MIKIKHLSRLASLQAIYQAFMRKIPLSNAFANIFELINECVEESYEAGFENIIMPEIISNLKSNPEIMNELQMYSEELIFGIEKNIDSFNDFLSQNDKTRSVSRIDLPLYAILLVAMYEMDFVEDLDYQISMNEALEFSKVFCGDESRKYLNSVLQAFLDK